MRALALGQNRLRIGAPNMSEIGKAALLVLSAVLATIVFHAVLQARSSLGELRWPTMRGVGTHHD